MKMNSFGIIYLLVSTTCLRSIHSRPLPSQPTEITYDATNSINATNEEKSSDSGVKDVAIKVVGSIFGAIGVAIIGYIISVWKKFKVPIEFTDKYRKAYRTAYNINSDCCVYGWFSKSGYFLSQFICCCCCKPELSNFKEIQYEEHDNWNRLMISISYKITEWKDVESMLSSYSNYNLHFQNFCKYENCENHLVNCKGCTTPPASFLIVLDWTKINTELELNNFAKEDVDNYENIANVALLPIAESDRPSEKKELDSAIKALKDNKEGIYVVLLNFPPTMQGLKQIQMNALKVILSFIKTYHVKHCYSFTNMSTKGTPIDGTMQSIDLSSDETSPLISNNYDSYGINEDVNEGQTENVFAAPPTDKPLQLPGIGGDDVSSKQYTGLSKAPRTDKPLHPTGPNKGYLEEKIVKEKMILYKLNKRFYGRSTDGKVFCNHFTDYDDDVENVFGNSDKYDYPVLEVVAKKFSDERYENPLEIVNKALRDSGNVGMLLQPKHIEENPFTNLNTNVKIDFSDNPTRKRTFEDISKKCAGDERFIAHFLLAYSDIEILVRNDPNNIKGRLTRVLDKWSDTYELATWPYLKSLLIFLKKTKVVEDIEKNPKIVKIDQ